MSIEKEFEENWKSVREENQKIDDITERRIQNGIENRIKKKKTTKKMYWVAAILVPFFALLMIYKPAHTLEETTEANFVFETFEKEKSFQLPDGSSIKLEPHSKLTLSESFGKKNRNVIFTGQGQFNITKDKTKPFRINAGDFNVQVLGTQFFLDQTSEEKKVELFEGKVKIEHADKITYLMPKEIWINSEEKSDYHYYNQEKQQDFIFENSNYSDAISQLESTYNITISYPEKFRNKKVSGSFKGNFKEVLSVISFPFNLKPEKINDKEIQLK